MSEKLRQEYAAMVSKERHANYGETRYWLEQYKAFGKRLLDATPPASHDAGEAVTEALEGIDIAKMESLGWQIALCSVCGMSASAFRPDPRIATLTTEVSRLTGELDAASARLHEVATLCATVEQERDRLTAELEEVREQRNRITATMTGELEKETAHSKHLAGAVSRKIEELIAVENQCGYYRMQYTRCEQVRKEACEANVKAQAAMLWLEADLERSRQECEGLREALRNLLQETHEPSCDHVHHAKRDQHKYIEACPVIQRHRTAVGRAVAALSQPGKGG